MEEEQEEWTTWKWNQEETEAGEKGGEERSDGGGESVRHVD